MDSILCLYAQHVHCAAQPNATEVIVIEGNNASTDEAFPSTHSSETLPGLLSYKHLELPAVSPRATTSNPPCPPKTLQERLMDFVKSCRSRVKLFFVEKNFISQFTKHASANTSSPLQADLEKVWRNFEKDFFLNAEEADLRKICSKLYTKIMDADLKQLERMNDYISDLETYKAESDSPAIRGKRGQFFSELANALMSRSLDFFLEKLVEQAYNSRKTNNWEINAQELYKGPLQVSAKVVSLIRCIKSSCPTATEAQEFIEKQELELKQCFMARVDRAYSDVCCKIGNGALVDKEYQPLKNRIEAMFSKLILHAEDSPLLN